MQNSFFIKIFSFLKRIIDKFFNLRKYLWTNLYFIPIAIIILLLIALAFTPSDSDFNTSIVSQINLYFI